MLLEALGKSPINTGLKVGISEFTSIFRDSPAVFSDGGGRYPRTYVKTRGILINREVLKEKPIDFSKGYQFQFNPQTISDIKETLYETRPYAGLPYNDYIWNNGGERIISFELFMDNTPQSKTAEYRPTEVNNFNSTLAKTVINEGVNPVETSLPMKGNAFSTTRVSARGILPEVELLQSYLYPEAINNEATPMFAEGGVVSTQQFRPPAILVLCVGPLYLEGVLKSAPVDYQLFDKDLTPLRATVNIEFAVFEHRYLTREIERV